MEVVRSFESRDPRRTLVVSFRGQFHFAAPLSLACRALSLLFRVLAGTSGNQEVPLVPQQASGSCKKSDQSSFLLNFSCRYACQKKRPPNSNSVFLLLLMPFPQSDLVGGLPSFLALFAFPFVDRSRSFLSLRVASTGIERQETLEKKRGSATRVNILGEASFICRAGPRSADQPLSPLRATPYTAIKPSQYITHKLRGPNYRHVHCQRAHTFEL